MTINLNYSEEFRNLISNKDSTQKLIEGSFVKNADFEKWTKMRAFIAGAINQSGKVIDIGCANGFLLRCLQEWSTFRLIPYGIDPESHLINEAKKIFLKHKDNFVVARLEDFENLKSFGLPQVYNIIIWNVWDNWHFKTENELYPIKVLPKYLDQKGRLILTFYDAKKDNNLLRIQRLKDKGYKIDGVEENPTDSPEVVCWIDNK